MGYISNLFKEEFKRRNLFIITRPKVWITALSLSAIIALGTTLEEVREVSLVNNLYAQVSGTKTLDSNFPYSYQSSNYDKKIDYLQQKGINPDLPLVNYLRTHKKNSQKN
jgi:hypothetical protein